MGRMSTRRRTANTIEAFANQLHQWRHDRQGDVEFIHINKTAGSSVEKALGLPFAHYTARDRIERLGLVEWNRRYSFTIVRNPWERLVSQYHHRKGHGRVLPDQKFADWVRGVLVEQDQSLKIQPLMFVNQLDWISSTSGEVVVDDIFRYEHLRRDFAVLCGKLDKRTTLPHEKPSAHEHFSSYYDTRTADIVGAYFERDIVLLGYQFDVR